VRPRFNPAQLRLVREASQRAAALVSDYYRIAPREWENKMRYEVCTLRSLAPSEVTDAALAQVLCYDFKRQFGQMLLDQGEIYRICLQDHRILDAAKKCGLQLGPLLVYIIAHELVHVVRFGQRLQRVDLPEELRQGEEQYVEDTVRKILKWAGFPNPLSQQARRAHP
jgi:hypothetical protein